MTTRTSIVDKDEKHAKDKIIEAALNLFYFQGYKGTTIRQIADEAEVNLALISYYFGGKKGLVETIMINFYEGYFQQIEKQTMVHLAEPAEMLDNNIWAIILSSFNYLFSNYKMTRFIYRELTLDSMLIREVMTTYLAKEKFLYLTLFKDFKTKGELDEGVDLEIIVLQLLNLLYMPFLQPQVIREVYYIEPLQAEFKERYLSQLKQWLTSLYQ